MPAGPSHEGVPHVRASDSGKIQLLIFRELERPSRCGGGAIVTAGAEFHLAVDDAEVEPVDEAAVAALLAEIPHARPRQKRVHARLRRAMGAAQGDPPAPMPAGRKDPGGIEAANQMRNFREFACYVT